jgi:hypothetical protein
MRPKLGAVISQIDGPSVRLIFSITVHACKCRGTSSIGEIGAIIMYACLKIRLIIDVLYDVQVYAR